MKKIFLIAMPALLLLLHSCEPAKYKTLEQPTNVIPYLGGTWKLSQVTQTDEDAAHKGFPYQTLDLTSSFAYTDFKLTFNLTGNTPGTFTTTPGNSPKIIKLASGSWTADDATYPKVLTMVNGTDTSKITLEAYPTGTNPNLKIMAQRFDALSGKLLISYHYVFIKQ